MGPCYAQNGRSSVSSDTMAAPQSSVVADFTSQQQEVLRNQVAAFKFFEALNRKMGIPQALKGEWLPLLHPLPLDAPGYSTMTVRSLSSDIYAYRNQVVEVIKSMKRRYDKARGKDFTDPALSDPLIVGAPPLLVASNINVSGDRSNVWSPHVMRLGSGQGGRGKSAVGADHEDGVSECDAGAVSSRVQEAAGLSVVGA